MAQQEQWPSVGRIVHLRVDATSPAERDRGEKKSRCLAAKIADVETAGSPDSVVNLGYLDRFGRAGDTQDVPRGDADGEWHWPEYVGPAAV